MLAIIRQICFLHNLQAESYSPAAGGDISKAYIVITTTGPYFLKLNNAAQYPNMFLHEAEGLQHLQSATNLTIPKVYGTGRYNHFQYLLMQLLNRTAPDNKVWQTLAKGLVQLHKNTCNTFGYDTHNYIGSLIQPNNRCKEWHLFYSYQRLMPLAERLFNSGQFSVKIIQLLERLAAKMDSLFPVEPPALLHGDLWLGNFMPVAINGNVNAAIFDPAVYFGHREMDIGMTFLFGGFDKSFYEYYRANYPLAPGWEQRIALTQLYPLMVHAVLFGGGYISRCTSIIERYA